VLAVLGCLRQTGLDRMLAARPRRERELVVAMIVARLLEPASKLATTRNWHNSTLASSLGVEDADEDELYAALDWLLSRQPKVEEQLAERHLSEGGLVLDADAVIMALPAYQCSRLASAFDPNLAQLMDSVPYSSAMTVSMAKRVRPENPLWVWRVTLR